MMQSPPFNAVQTKAVLLASLFATERIKLALVLVAPIIIALVCCLKLD